MEPVSTRIEIDDSWMQPFTERPCRLKAVERYLDNVEHPANRYLLTYHQLHSGADGVIAADDVSLRQLAGLIPGLYVAEETSGKDDVRFGLVGAEDRTITESRDGQLYCQDVYAPDAVDFIRGCYLRVMSYGDRMLIGVTMDGIGFDGRTFELALLPMRAEDGTPLVLGGVYLLPE